METKRYDYKKLEELSVKVFESLGFTNEESRQITDVLIVADLYGIASHGMQRLYNFVNSIKIGRVKVGVKPEIIKETPVSAVIDGHDGSGQLNSIMGMNVAIKKAQDSGIGFVIVKNNTHYGIAGYYARMAMLKGLLGISMTNSEALVVPTYGKRAMLGSNPFAVAMPADPYPFFLDVAMATVPRGKLEIYMKNEKPVPAGWALGQDGRISTDPVEVDKCFTDKTCGGILPLGGLGEILGGHKGYGLGLTIELLTGILGLGYPSDMIRKDKLVDKNCTTFIAIDYGIFGDKKEIEDNFSKYLQKLRDSEKCDGETRIYTHGEKEFERAAACEEKGIFVQEKTIEEIIGICREAGIDYRPFIVEKG